MITDEEAMRAVAGMRLCRYFPSDEFQRAQIAAILIKMVNTKRELDWLVETQANFDWKGPQELRGLFCSKFRPRDGIETVSSNSGFTPEDGERAYFEEQSRETDRKLAEWKQEQKRLGESPVRFDVTPAIKRIGVEPDPVSDAAVPFLTRTERDLRARNASARLAATAGKEETPTHISATRKRTPEENDAEVRRLKAELARISK